MSVVPLEPRLVGTCAPGGETPDPQVGPVAPVRLGLLRAAVVVGAVAVLSTEALSAAGLVTRASVAAVWATLGALAVAVGLARWWPRHHTRQPGLTARPAVPRWSPSHLVVLAALGLILLGELVLALASAPNTYDSQTYHLPRIEHWVAQQSVEAYPVRIHRQVTYPPGAEYLLLHLRLLTGGQALSALPQWLAGLACLAAVTRMAVQLGGGRRAQLVTAFLVATAPPVVLEASSTQVDLVVAAWVAVVATVVLDGVGPGPVAPPTPAGVLTLAAATGLVAVTKSTALVVTGLLLAWWALAWLHRRRAGAVRGVVASALTVAAFTTALTGPYLWRMYSEFGNVLGPEYLRDSITLDRHDPAAVAVNLARQTHSMMDTPLLPLGRVTGEAVLELARLLRVDPQDPGITFDGSTFPAATWYPSEGRAAMPVTGLVLAIGGMAVLVNPGPRRRRHHGHRRRGLASVAAAGVVIHAATVAWSPWGTRLTLYLMMLGAPVAGVWVAAMLGRAPWRRSRPRRAPEGGPAAVTRPALVRILGQRLAGAVPMTLAVALLVGWASGALSVAYGWPRRLVGSQSALVLSDWESLFVLRPAWAGDFATAGGAVRASGARRIGLVQDADTWEYPWWILFEGRQVVALQSMVPRRPPLGVGAVEAVVCTSTLEVCRWYVPPDWQITEVGVVAYALPPGRGAPGEGEVRGAAGVRLPQR